MIQVQIDRKPYAKHSFYKGVYTFKNINYDFEVIEEWSENCLQPALILEFELAQDLLPFDYQNARKQILDMFFS